MINKINGHITISYETELAPNDSFERLCKLKQGESQEIRDMKNGWKWLDWNNVRVDNEYFIFNLGFFNDKLKILNFVVKENAFDLRDPGSGLEDKQYQLELRKWLINELGSEGQFLWGHISVCEDKKVGGYSIYLDYQLTTFRSWLDRVRNFIGKNE